MDIVFSFDAAPGLEGVNIGLVEAAGIMWPESAGSRETDAPVAPGKMESGASAALDPRFAAIVDDVRLRGGEAIPATRKAAVRSMLRRGVYKPAGRGKPSSEYLMQAAIEGDFPSVNFPVDAVNIVSLTTGYPISIFDAEKSGKELLLRTGRAGESYVFNSGGQTIDLEDLLCVCRKTDGGFVPTANPVRDSMATKVFPGASKLVAVIYAPAGTEGRDLEAACSRLSAYLSEKSAGAHCDFAIFRSR